MRNLTRNGGVFCARYFKAFASIKRAAVSIDFVWLNVIQPIKMLHDQGLLSSKFL
jgi:hypothetical protein